MTKTCYQCKREWEIPSMRASCPKCGMNVLESIFADTAEHLSPENTGDTIDAWQTDEKEKLSN